MRVVCDTNVLVAALIADGLCRDVVKRRLTRVELFTSAGLVRELETTLRNKFRATTGDLAFVDAYRERAVLIRPAKLHKPVCRDPDDDLVLATAQAAKADCILTGDQDLLVLERFLNIAILAPRAFAELMDRG